ncbi:MAG TPA: hypothetical protein VHG93_18950 [Longimicrobium sp.]|nr:hypothetical protein [Longimicrobium sp.]
MAAALGGCTPPGPPLSRGDAVPESWLTGAPATADSQVVLVWLFRTADCLTCQSLDYAIRRIQAGGDAPPFAAVHVGRTDGESVPRHFFRGRRIRVASLVTVSPGEFRGAAGSTPLPALLVTRGRRVAWTSALPRGVTTAEQLDSLIQDVRGAVAAGGTSVPPRGSRDRR